MSHLNKTELEAYIKELEAGQKLDISILTELLMGALKTADKMGYVVRLKQVSLMPPRMGYFQTVLDIRPSNPHYRAVDTLKASLKALEDAEAAKRVEEARLFVLRNPMPVAQVTEPKPMTPEEYEVFLEKQKGLDSELH